MIDTPRTDAAEKHAYQFKDEWTPVCESKFVRQLESELNAATSEIERLRKANLQLREGAEEQKHQIQTLKWDLDANRNTCSRKNDRIRHLIRLGLETTRPEALDQWREEEEQ